MSRRILMLISTWDVDFAKAIIAGIRERIGDDDIELHILNAYDDLRPSDYFVKGREIYFLPDLEKYDGLIIDLITIDSVQYVKDITKSFHDLNKPVVGVDTHAENAIFCGLDNYRSMYQLVDHMVTIHDCRIFNYLGGPEDHDESKERYRAFCDCLKSHGIGVEKKRVLHKNFRQSDGNAAYNEWKELGVNMADVVICANDYMALGFTEEAAKDGIIIPDYLKVTGFDNIRDAQRFTPSITSINRNWKRLGYESMDILLEALSNNMEYDTRFVEGYIRYNESCGCDLSRDIRSEYTDLVAKARSDSNYIYKQNYSRQILTRSRTMEDFMSAMSNCKVRLGIADAAVCLNRSFFDGDVYSDVDGYDKEMILYIDDGKEDINTDNQLYPARWKKDYKIYLFASLRNDNQTYGYMVMPYDEEFFSRIKHRTFVESLSLGLENISNRIAISKLKEKIKDQ